LLGDIRRGAGTAGRVEHEIAGVGGHEEAFLDDLGVCLNDIRLLRCIKPLLSIFPEIRNRLNWVVFSEQVVSDAVFPTD
jgi:hypothetical protein